MRITSNNANVLKVLFAASEMAPIAKVGGLGDVIGSLPKALVKLGADARVIIPFYEQIKSYEVEPRKILDFRVGEEMATLYEMKLSRQHSNILQNVGMLARNGKGVEVYLIENKKYLSRGPIYFEKTAFAGSQKEIDRFVFFSQAVYQLLQRPDFFQPDIVHCNDWHTGLLVRAARNQRSKISPAGNGKKSKKPRIIFSIHNLANQGAAGGTNWMAEGIKNADVAATVSPTYAKEILTPKFGEGLENLLRKKNREGKLVGILNGIDYDFWPLQKRNKMLFQKKLKLEPSGRIPVFGLVSRLTRQKGIRLIIPLVADFVRKYRAQFVFLGQGEEEIEIGLKKLARRFPKNVYVKIGFDEKLAQAVYAQSDFFLMPSRFEPSGLGQMIAMRYGTVPIVRATGGLKDTVADGKTGIVFREESSAGLENALSRAVNLFYKTPRKLKTMANNCKKQNFSWNRASEKYLRIYRALLTSF